MKKCADVRSFVWVVNSGASRKARFGFFVWGCCYHSSSWQMGHLGQGHRSLSRIVWYVWRWEGKNQWLDSNKLLPSSCFSLLSFSFSLSLLDGCIRISQETGLVACWGDSNPIYIWDSLAPSVPLINTLYTKYGSGKEKRELNKHERQFLPAAMLQWPVCLKLSAMRGDIWRSQLVHLQRLYMCGRLSAKIGKKL